MKRKLLYSFITLLLAGGTSINAYFLYVSYGQYTAPAAPGKLSLTATSKVANAKQKSVGVGKQGEQVGQGQYAFQERDHSKIQASDSTAQLAVASNEGLGANFVLADSSGGTLNSNKLTADWTLQTVNVDPMWAPGACASKPTYFLQKHFIFIDDGKTLPTDRYNSYVVFDMLTQKFRYFGGDNFTESQAKKEKILSVVDENDQIVFYIDQPDSEGPLANSASFKHAQASAPGYITRRVIDLSTLHYTDYHLKFTVPQVQTFSYYYVNVGVYSNELIRLSSDATNNYYSGTVNNNAIDLALRSTTLLQPNQTVAPTDPLVSKLDPILANALPSFLQKDGSSSGQNGPRFSIKALGSQGSLKFLDISNLQSEFGTPLVYDESASTVKPMTTQPVLDWGSYVALGVF